MIVDDNLMTRVEDAMAAERSAFADGMSALRPDLGAGWFPVAGGRAIFTGADFFSNRAMAMGLTVGPDAGLALLVTALCVLVARSREKQKT